jgi:two-component system sensor histidine kinase BaeS
VRARPPLRKSLLGRLLAVSVLVAVGSVAATAWLAVRTTSGAIKNQQGRVLADDAAVYDTLLGYAATRPDWNGAGALVQKLSRHTGRRSRSTPPTAPPARSPTGRPRPSTR